MKNKEKSIILIIDDKPGNILALEGLLASKDRLVLKATSGKDGLQIALHREVDLIILDVQMPDMNGFEVAQILKSKKRTRDIPIIFATAENKEHRYIMQGYDEGAIDYLFKPLDPEIVNAKVAVLLKIQLQKKELLEKNNSLQKSALLINNCADIIGIINTSNFRIEEINDAFYTILGYNEEEVKDTSLTFFLPDEDRDVLEKLKNENQERFSFETRIYSKNRTLKWLQWKVVSKNGSWFVNARDTTEINEVERIRNYLSTVVKQSKDAIYIHDYEGKIISWNEGAEKMYGYREREALKMKIWNIIPEYLQNESGEIVSKILYGSEIQNLQTKRMTKHGKLIDVLFSASVITESRDKGLSIAITERDVTDQKNAVEKIKENERFLKSILDTMEDSVIVVDGEGKSILLNPAAEKNFGKNSMSINVTEWSKEFGIYNFHEKTTLFPVERLPIVQALKGQISVSEEIFIINPQIPKGIYVVASSNPLKDSHSKIIGGVCVMHDISARKLAEETLKESELRFRNLFEFAPFPMWVYDLQSLRFLEVNKQAVTQYGFSRDEFLSMDIHDIRPTEDINELIPHLYNRKQTVSTPSEWRHCLHDGTIINVEITSHLIDFKGHKAALVIAKNITEQKKTEEKVKQLNAELTINVRQLEATNNELESFSYSVSHDLRAPLRGLSGYSKMLEEDYSDILDEEAKRLLRNINGNAKQMGTLIDDLIAFSRLGRANLKTSEVNFDNLVNGIIAELNHAMPHNAKLTIQPLLSARADASLLKQVWTNLISNAIKYSSKSPSPYIEITSMIQDGEIVYRVSDNGTGFNMKYADKLFGVFQRLHKSTDFEGTGIGLAIVQRIITKHGGRVWAEGKENEGANFYFSLPEAII